MRRQTGLSLSVIYGLLAPWVASSSIYFMSAERWWSALGVFILATAISALSLEGLIQATSDARGKANEQTREIRERQDRSSNLDRAESSSQFEERG